MKPAGSALLSVLLLTAAYAQAPPRLQAVFPAGGKAGSRVEVVFSGGLAGLSEVLVFGGDVTGALKPAGQAADPAGRRLFESKCASCHELRSPNNRQMTPPQWELTVARMIDRNRADIDAGDRAKIVDYLKATAAAGLVTGALTIPATARPGFRELRLAGPTGVSTGYPFYVSDLDETVESEPNDTFEQARPVKLPVVVNGICSRGGDVDRIRFEAQRGQRLLLRATAYRLSPDSQNFFDACLYLYDSDGHRLAQNLGYENLDPLIDFTVPRDGTYSLECRDLMYRGGGACVYRLEVGELGYHQSIYPLGAQRGSPFEAVILSENQPARSWKSSLPAELEAGITDLETPFGLFRFLVTGQPDYYDNGAEQVQRVKLPCAVNGWIGQPGEKDRYLLDLDAEQARQLRPWSVVGPFDGQSAGGLDRVFPPETDVLAGRFSAAGSYPIGDQSKSWESRQPNATGNHDLGNGANQVWYAVHTFQMRAEAAGLLSLGSDDGCKVWVNGELVHTSREARPVRPANDLIPLRLKRGGNTILLKVFNVSGPSGFTAAAGAWSVDVFARRLGSPLRPEVKLGFGRGWICQPSNNPSSPDRPGDDVRFDWSFAQPGEYGLQLTDADGRGGERYAYRMVIAPAQPSASLVTYPANPCVPAGGQVPIFVDRESLSGYAGDLKLRLDGLPPGLSAPETWLPADVTSAFLLLTAAPGAKPGFAPIKVIGEAPSLDGPVTFAARPQDHFRIQNNAIPVPRKGMVAAVTAQAAPYSLAVTPATVPVRPGANQNLTIRVTRRPDFRDDVTLILRNLPPPIRANATVVRADRREANLELIFPDSLRRQGFGESLQQEAYRCVVLGLSGGDGLTGGTMYASNPIVLQPYDPTREPRREPAQPEPATAVLEAAGRQVLEKKCTVCHALYDPEQTRKTYAAWTATVERMIGKGAAINAQERGQLLAYLQAVTRRQMQ